MATQLSEARKPGRQPLPSPRGEGHAPSVSNLANGSAVTPWPTPDPPPTREERRASPPRPAAPAAPGHETAFARRFDRAAAYRHRNPPRSIDPRTAPQDPSAATPAAAPVDVRPESSVRNPLTAGRPAPPYAGPSQDSSKRASMGTMTFAGRPLAEQRASTSPAVADPGPQASGDGQLCLHGRPAGAEARASGRGRRPRFGRERPPRHRPSTGAPGKNADLARLRPAA